MLIAAARECAADVNRNPAELAPLADAVWTAPAPGGEANGPLFRSLLAEARALAGAPTVERRMRAARLGDLAERGARRLREALEPALRPPLAPLPRAASAPRPAPTPWWT